VEDIYALYDKLDTFRGLDENGGSLDNAVVSGTIHVGTVSSDDIAIFAERYPNVTIDYKTIGNGAKFLVDGVEFARQVYAVGEQIKAPAKIPSKEATAQYTFTYKGWSADGVNTVSSFGKMGEANVTFYALFDEVARIYTIRFYNGTTLLQTSQVVYGVKPSYVREEPTMEGKDFGGWIPDIAPVTGDADYVAKFITPSVTRAYLKGAITEYSSENVTSIRRKAFDSSKTLVTLDVPNVITINSNAFYGAQNLQSANISSVVTINGQAFDQCTRLASVKLPVIPPVLTTASAFRGNSIVFYIPTGSLSAYQNATNWSSLTSTYSFVEEDR
jgi:hypothetical protein